MHRDFARLPQATVHDDVDLLWYTTPGSNSWLNGASRCDLAADATERIGSLVATADELDVALMWHQTPTSLPRHLPQMLSDCGFEPSLEPGMSVSLARAPAPPPAELTISAVTEQAGVLEWVNTFDVAFGGEPRGMDHPWLTAFGRLYTVHHPPGRLLTGLVHGVAVGTALAFTSGGVVGLYGIGVVPEQRGHGYGAAMTVAAMEWGRHEGANLAVLEASVDGFPVYEQLGFQTTCETTAWLRAPGVA